MRTGANAGKSVKRRLWLHFAFRRQPYKHRLKAIVFALLCFGSACVSLIAADAPQRSALEVGRVLGASRPKADSRIEFVKALQACINAIEHGKENTSPAEMFRAFLGPPDEVRVRPAEVSLNDPLWGNVPDRMRIAWCYGTTYRGGFPTLGQVFFTKDKGEIALCGDEGIPPRVGLFDEQALRDLLALMNTVSRCDGIRYDPLPLIRAVNALQPLGKEKALAVIDEYLRVAPSSLGSREEVFLILRVLFDIPVGDDAMPKMALGQPGPAWPIDRREFPRFPIVLKDDVPLLLVVGYWGAGAPQRPEEHVAYFREHGRIRGAPLRPGAAPHLLPDRVLQADQLKWRSPLGPQAEQQWLLDLLRLQVMRMLDTLPKDPDGPRQRKDVMSGEAKLDWKSALRELNELEFQWDSVDQQYRITGEDTTP